MAVRGSWHLFCSAPIWHTFIPTEHIHLHQHTPQQSFQLISSWICTFIYCGNEFSIKIFLATVKPVTLYNLFVFLSLTLIAWDFPSTFYVTRILSILNLSDDDCLSNSRSRYWHHSLLDPCCSLAKLILQIYHILNCVTSKKLFADFESALEQCPVRIFLARESSDHCFASSVCVLYIMPRKTDF